MKPFFIFFFSLVGYQKIIFCNYKSLSKSTLCKGGKPYIIFDNTPKIYWFLDFWDTLPDFLLDFHDCLIMIIPNYVFWYLFYFVAADQHQLQENYHSKKYVIDYLYLFSYSNVYPLSIISVFNLSSKENYPYKPVMLPHRRWTWLGQVES